MDICEFNLIEKARLLKCPKHLDNNITFLQLSKDQNGRGAYIECEEDACQSN